MTKILLLINQRSSRQKILLSMISMIFFVMGTARESVTMVNGYAASAHRIVIKIQDDIAPMPGRSDALNLASPLKINAYLRNQGARSLEPLFKDWQNFSERHFAHQLHQFYLVIFDSPVDVSSIINDLMDYNEVIVVEPDYQVRQTMVPDDPYYSDQWAHDNFGQAGEQNVGVPDCDTDTDQAWDITTGEADIIIAILDTGIDGRHPEFSGKMVPGYDFVNNDHYPLDDNGHGTGCAGIAAALGNNNQGIAGVSWESQIMPIKILNSDAYGDITDIANGVTWATDNGARIISMSLSGGSYLEYFNSAINAAVDNGTVVFAATGNGDSGIPAYPSNYDNCIAVGALSPCNERKNPNSCDGEYLWGSNFGPHLDFLAPGVLMHTTTMDGGYMSYFNGTSAACPHAAGIGALVLSVNPSMSPEEVRNIMQLTSDDLYETAWDEQSGYGRLNAYHAVSMALDSCENYWTPGDVNNDGLLNVLDLVIVTNLILGVDTDAELCLIWSADYDDNGDINVLDIIQIINVIIDG
ncbi:MAG: S8 family serine peptidase [Candidatus Marinimicrobia bacterium]|nr:S8 family serine peptidase [Candidatus Neomarinimicrobiota bacterium]